MRGSKRAARGEKAPSSKHSCSCYRTAAELGSQRDRHSIRQCESGHTLLLLVPLLLQPALLLLIMVVKEPESSLSSPCSTRL